MHQQDLFVVYSRVKARQSLRPHNPVSRPLQILPEAAKICVPIAAGESSIHGPVSVNVP